MRKNFTVRTKEKEVSCVDGVGSAEAVKFFWDVVSDGEPFEIEFVDEDGTTSKFSVEIETGRNGRYMWIAEGTNSYDEFVEETFYENDLWELLDGSMTASDEAMTETDLIRKALKATYSLYMADWMRRISPEQIMTEIRICFENQMEDVDWNSDLRTHVELEHGFGGSLYVCFDEFLGAEMLDEEYRKFLIDDCKPLEETLDLYFELLEGKNG